jgi:hypothetical protein
LRTAEYNHCANMMRRESSSMQINSPKFRSCYARKRSDLPLNPGWRYVFSLLHHMLYCCTKLHAYVYALTCFGVFHDACSLIQDRISTTRLASYKIHMFYMIDLEDSVPANIFTVSRKYVLCFQFTFTQ